MVLNRFHWLLFITEQQLVYGGADTKKAMQYNAKKKEDDGCFPKTRFKEEGNSGGKKKRHYHIHNREIHKPVRMNSLSGFSQGVFVLTEVE
jgi:hypothetical protein